MILAEIETAAARHGLTMVGAFHPVAEDLPPEGVATLCLFGPGGPEMWDAFTASPEHADGAPHAMDRWSRRILGTLAESFGARAFFPFGGPPYQPFQRWAIKAEGAVSSPVGMQVTPTRGLWTSYRGALGLRQMFELPRASFAAPCNDCPAPCLTACPVDAFASGSYDVPTCTAHVRCAAGTDCQDGCLVRKSCPFGANLTLPAAQRAFHIEAFLRANG